MSAPDPAPPATAPVEKKTWAALAGGLLTALVAVALNVPEDVVTTLPAPVRLVITLLAGLAPFVAAYLAPHTPRPLAGRRL